MEDSVTHITVRLALPAERARELLLALAACLEGQPGPSAGGRDDPSASPRADPPQAGEPSSSDLEERLGALARTIANARSPQELGQMPHLPPPLAARLQRAAALQRRLLGGMR